MLPQTPEASWLMGRNRDLLPCPRAGVNFVMNSEGFSLMTGEMEGKISDIIAGVFLCRLVHHADKEINIAGTTRATWKYFLIMCVCCAFLVMEHYTVVGVEI